MSLLISVLHLCADAADAAGIAERLGGQSLSPAAFELVVVDRSDGFGAAAAVAARQPRFEARVLRQQPTASLADAGNLAVFAAAAPLLLFLDRAVRPEPGLLAAHVAAHGQAAGGRAVIGRVRVGAAALGRWRRLVSFGWRQPAPPQPGWAWGGSVSFEREALIRASLFDPLGRPGFEDVEPAWRLAERPFAPLFAAEAAGALEGAMTVDDWLGRAYQLGLQEAVYRSGRRRSLSERIGRPEDWFDKRAHALRGAEALYAAARRAVGENAPANAAGAAWQAFRRALHAAWREGRREAMRRQQAADGRRVSGQ